ncbi:MAG: sodium/glutamate symporter [Pseudomonadota bacterium]
MQDTFVAHPFLSVTLGILVYFIGAFLTRSVRFLRDFSIPEPVSGGLAIAVVVWLWRAATGSEIVFELAVRDYLLVIFFACIGLNARIADLIVGGKRLAVLLALTIGFMVLQNGVGVIGAGAFGLPGEVGVLLGTASLIGGHGTAIAWGPTIEAETGFAAAAEIGVAAATLGLILAAVLCGPIAKWLIERNRLSSDQGADDIVGLSNDEPGAEEAITHVSLMRAMLAAHVAVIIGWILNGVIADLGLKLPLFVPCLFVGIAMSNTIPLLAPGLPWPARTKALAVVSDYCLSVFLAMSLMSLQLWTLASLGGPLITVLLAQAVMTAAFILFVFYRVMGGGYDAAVLSAGFAGFGLGATPTAIANMSAVAKR